MTKYTSSNCPCNSSLGKIGEKTAVVVPIRDFEQRLEDLEDLAAIAERREEPTMTHDELVAEFKRDERL